MPGLTRYPGEGGPRIVQQPLSSGLRPMITMVIRPWGYGVAVAHVGIVFNQGKAARNSMKKAILPLAEPTRATSSKQICRSGADAARE